MFWNVPVTSVRIGYRDKYSDGSVKAWKFRKQAEGCLDTGTTVVLVPMSFFETFMASLLKGKSAYYDDYSESYYAVCDLKLYESVFISIGNRYFEIPPSKYVVIEEDVDLCAINFL